MKKLLRKIRIALGIANATDKAIEALRKLKREDALNVVTAWPEIRPVLISLKAATRDQGDDAIDKIIEVVDKALGA